MASDDWNRRPLGEVLTLKRGYDLPKRNRSSGDVPVVSSSGITGSHDKSRVSGPGVVTGRYGTLGRVFYLDQDFWPLNTTLYVEDFQGTDPRFASYLLSTLDLERYSGASAVPGVDRNVLHEIEVAIPPSTVQRTIGLFLSYFDELVENCARRRKVLQEMAQAIYDEWFVNFRFPGHENVEMEASKLGPIPENWEVVPSTSISHILSGGTPKTTVPEYWEGNIPFFTPKEASESFYVIDTSKTVSRRGIENCSSELYEKDDVFITSRGTVGKVVLAGRPMAMNQSCYALRGREGVSNIFVFFAIRACVDRLRQKAHGAVFDTIIMDTFERILVPRPPATIIEQFVETVSPILEEILVLDKETSVLRDMLSLLLPRVVSGAIDVGDMDTGLSKWVTCQDA